VRVQCRREASSRSLSHLLVSFLSCQCSFMGDDVAVKVDADAMNILHYLSTALFAQMTKADTNGKTTKTGFLLQTFVVYPSRS